MYTGFLTLGEYRHMGLRCGLEVHQQLRTRHKLFCRCPNSDYTNRYGAELLRHMRPTLSEMGEYDRTALMEFRTRKEIFYRLNRERVCTYEMDDAPPFALNQEALDIALEIALLFRCSIVGEIHVTRKQYLDGSIPAGFQRTMIVGLGGWFPMGDRQIRVRQISLEEDACREVSDRGHDRVYYTDRLCVPLVEVVTEPDFLTPEEAFEGAEVIRRVTRVTGKVRRGPGSARQDTNVSVSGGDRVEIKGVPSTLLLPRLVHMEGIRQRALIEIAAILGRRGLVKASFDVAWQDLTRLIRMSTYPPIRDALSGGGVVHAVRLPRFAGILRHSLGGERRFIDELRDRVRVVACLDGVPNLLYSEDPEPNIAQRIWRRAAMMVEASDDDDAVVLVWGPPQDVVTACEEIIWRSRDALDGVLPDTRQVRSDGTTRFERVLAGPNRMYPDTDMPPEAITAQRLDSIQRALPAFPWDQYETLTERHGLPHDAADALVLAGNADLCLRVIEELGILPAVGSHVLTNVFRRLQRRWTYPERIPESILFDFFRAYAGQRFTREVAAEILTKLAHNADSGLDAALAGVPLRKKMTDSQCDAEVHPLLVPENELLSSVVRTKAESIAMGLAMPHVRGLTTGKEVLASVRRFLSALEVRCGN